MKLPCRDTYLILLISEVSPCLSAFALLVDFPSPNWAGVSCIMKAVMRRVVGVPVPESRHGWWHCVLWCDPKIPQGLAPRKCLMNGEWDSAGGTMAQAGRVSIWTNLGAVTGCGHGVLTWSNGWGWLPAYRQHVEPLGRCSRHGEAEREPALLRCAAQRGSWCFCWKFIHLKTYWHMGSNGLRETGTCSISCHNSVHWVSLYWWGKWA